jgi:hypothetical protein
MHNSISLLYILHSLSDTPTQRINQKMILYFISIENSFLDKVDNEIHTLSTRLRKMGFLLE